MRKEKIKIIISNNEIKMLHNDKINLSRYGKINITRASHVEYNNVKQCWEVNLPRKWFQFWKTKGKLLKSDFKTREEAINWEKDNIHLL